MNYARVTDLIDYLFCPRKVYLKRVLGLEEEKKEVAFLGELIHKVFDSLNEKEEEIVYEIVDDYPFDYILNLYEKTANEIINNILNEKEEEIKEFGFSKEDLFFEIKKHVYEDLYERAKNVYNSMKAYNEYGIVLWDLLEPKIKTELELISEKYELIGRVDRVEFYKDFLIPIEIKSGNSSRNHLVQIHAYSLLLKENFPKYKVPYGILYYTKLKKKKEIKFKEKYYNFILDLKDRVLEIVEREKDPGKNKDINKCKKCPFYNICYGKNRT